MLIKLFFLLMILSLVIQAISNLNALIWLIEKIRNNLGKRLDEKRIIFIMSSILLLLCLILVNVSVWVYSLESDSMNTTVGNCKGELIEENDEEEYDTKENNDEKNENESESVLPSDSTNSSNIELKPEVRSVVVKKFVGQTKASIVNTDDLRISYEYKLQNNVSSGTIVKQSIKPGTIVPRGSIITLTVALRHDKSGSDSTVRADDSMAENPDSYKSEESDKEDKANSSDSATESSSDKQEDPAPAKAGAYDNQQGKSDEQLDSKTDDSITDSLEYIDGKKPVEENSTDYSIDDSLSEELSGADGDVLNYDESTISENYTDDSDNQKSNESGYSDYSEIYEEYSQKIKDTAERLSEEWALDSIEDTNNHGDIEVAINDNISLLTDILAEGRNEIEDLYADEHQIWIDKLTDVYNEEVNRLVDFCTNNEDR